MLMQVMGYYIAFRVRQQELKSEVRVYLKSHKHDSHLTHLEFPAQNGKIIHDKFEWEEGDEFSFAGSMYDVIEMKVEKDKVVFTCLEDKRENDLLKSFEQIQKRQNRGKSRSATALQFLSVVYYSPETDVIPSFDYDSLTSYYPYQSPIFDRSGEILTPPPRNC